MALKEEFEQIGNWLFRWRSYLPLLMIGNVVLFMEHFDYIGHSHSHSLDQLWEIICLLISFLGLGIRIYTIGFTPYGTSGRNTKSQKAEQLNITGIYSLVRHPLYLGNFFIWLGISMFVHLWWVTLIFILVFWLYYERIMFAEEEFLRKKFGNEYVVWANKTSAFCPKFKNWEKLTLSFSLRNVLKREYSGFLE